MEITNHLGVRVAGPTILLGCLLSTASAQCGLQLLPSTPPAGADNTVRVITQWDPDGPGPMTARIVVGGDFRHVEGVPANRLAVLDASGSGWSSPGGGCNQKVKAILALPNGDLVVGGTFTAAGSVPANRIARWDGSAWHAFGSGMNLDVSALAVLPNGNIVAGGNFSNAGGTMIGGIARWDGSTWQAMGNWPDAEVQALLVQPNGDLIAGGAFTTIGGISANRIARWDGAQWFALGSGLQVTWAGGVRAITRAANGDLYVGGGLSAAGSVPVTGVARWDGTAWHRVGTLTNYSSPAATALVFLPNGDLLAGGLFYGGLARWDGQSWSPFASDPGGTVNALHATPSGDCWCGTDSSWLSYLSFWNGTSLRPFSTDPLSTDGVVSRLRTTRDGGLLAIGDFSMFRGSPAGRVARQVNGVWAGLGSLIQPIYDVAESPSGEVWISGAISGGIARWNGTGWSGLPVTPIHSAQCLVVAPDGDILIGGYLMQVPGGVHGPELGSPMVSRWNGVTWQVLSTPNITGGRQTVRHIALASNGDVIAAGSFAQISGVNAAAIARWNGTTWQALGAGVPGEVTSLLVMPDGSPVVSSTDSLGSTNYGIRRWDGSSWQVVGNLQGAAVAMTVLPNEDLVATGNLWLPGTPPGPRVMRWSGGVWQELLAGFSTWTTAIAWQPEGRLVVGGRFASLGGVPSGYLAELATNCPAVVQTVPTACSGPLGPLVLEAPQGLWLGATGHLQARGYTTQSLGVSILGFQVPNVPWTWLHPAALPGCNQLTDGVAIRLQIPVDGVGVDTLPIPAMSAFIGLTIQAQFLQFALDPAGGVQSLSASNGLRLTVGAF